MSRPQVRLWKKLFQLGQTRRQRLFRLFELLYIILLNAQAILLKVCNSLLKSCLIHLLAYVVQTNAGEGIKLSHNQGVIDLAIILVKFLVIIGHHKKRHVLIKK